MKTKTVKRRAVVSDHTSRSASRNAGRGASLCALASVAAKGAPSSRQTASKVMTSASTDTPAVTITRRAGEYGSSRPPATPAVIAKPAIIITHTVVAAAARRACGTRLASITSSEVPQALTPRPIITKPSTARARPASRCVCIQATASADSVPPAPRTAMPPTIQGVRRPPTSEPHPMRGRVACTA